MLESALKLLKKIEDNGFSAYIVGGFIRDRILGIKSVDIDITTSATPMDIRRIFKKGILPNEAYGSVTLVSKNVHFEITTFRKEYEYFDNRRPSSIEYVNNLYDDLLRRDFTINTLCMDSSGNIIDLLGAYKDLDDKIIKTVGESDVRFKEDSLRMLRAVRFATILNFELCDDVRKSIIRNKDLLKKLSYNRKRQELDKIFVSNNIFYGIRLIKELGLDDVLELNNIENIKQGYDLMGIWASIDSNSKYPFTNNEKEIINKVREVVKIGYIDNFTLYKYGSYICSVAGSILNIDRAYIVKCYDELPITGRKNIDITSNEIMSILNKGGGGYINDIYVSLEKEILDKRLINKKEDLIKYIKDNYS